MQVHVAADCLPDESQVKPTLKAVRWNCMRQVIDGGSQRRAGAALCMATRRSISGRRSRRCIAGILLAPKGRGDRIPGGGGRAETTIAPAVSRRDLPHRAGSFDQRVPPLAGPAHRSRDQVSSRGSSRCWCATMATAIEPAGTRGGAQRPLGSSPACANGRKRSKRPICGWPAAPGGRNRSGAFGACSNCLSGPLEAAVAIVRSFYARRAHRCPPFRNAGQLTCTRALDKTARFEAAAMALNVQGP